MNYRPDIDGLRTVAVITIMFFHYGITGFEGAFAGPEVFFVLSGYLIASKIFEKTDVNRFEFADFYYKRMRRLFPAYGVMMIASLIMAYLWMLPNDFKDFSKSFTASTVYLSNIQFYRESGYFDQASHLKPLLHTWSLSVEEQFYLFFPLTAVLFRKASRKQLFFIFFAMSLVSFVAAIITIEYDMSRVFYMFPYRIWELGLGVMLATGCYHLPKIKAHWANELLALLGITLILVPMVMYEPTMKFPGWAAVPACLGTWLIIQLDGSRMTIVQRFLALKPMTFVGTLSYSLYLWHWPVYVMYKYTDTDGIDVYELSGILVVVFLLSYLSYRFVEEPLRSGNMFFVKTKRAVFSSAGAFSVLFIVVGLYIYQSQGMPNRFDQSLQPAIAATHIFGDMSDCRELEESELKDIAYCQIGEPLKADRYTLVFGDSHSPTYRFAMSEALPDANILIAWSGGCPALFDVNVDELVANAEADQACLARNKAVKQLLSTDKRIDSIILLGRWSYYGRAKGLGVDISNTIKVWPMGESYDPAKPQYPIYMREFEKTVNTINDLGIKVFVIEQPPEFPDFNARTFVMEKIVGNDESNSELERITRISKDLLLERQGPMIELLDQLSAQGKIQLLRTHQHFCNEQQCSLIVNEMPLFFDNNHLSAKMAPKIKEIFTPFVEYQSTL